MKTLNAVALLNFLSSGAEVLADDPEIARVRGVELPADRFAALSEELGALAEEYAEELEAAFELALENGLERPVRNDECPRCGGEVDLDPSDDSVRYCTECGVEVVHRG